ncbi:MAG: RDD family protein, partial [Chitinophagales bacterium]
IDLVVIGAISIAFLFITMGKTPKNMESSGDDAPPSLMDKYQFFAYFEPIALDPHRDIYINRFIKNFPLQAAVGFIFIPWFFWGLLEGIMGGSIGKLLTGIRVRRKDGGKANVITCTVRFIAKIVSTLLLFIGYLIAFFDRKKQALHDKVANTLVLRK